MAAEGWKYESREWESSMRIKREEYLDTIKIRGLRYLKGSRQGMKNSQTGFKQELGKMY